MHAIYLPMFALWIAVLPAQESFLREERRAMRIAVGKLANFGKIAARKQMHARAREAFDLILKDYDPQHGGALRGLGFTKVDGEWREPGENVDEKDASKSSVRRQVEQLWDRTSRSLAKIHRELGLRWHPVDIERGRSHLQRAISFRHDDVEAHRALGHGNHEGYWGSDAELAFIRRMQALQLKAVEYSQCDYRVESVKSLPDELLALIAAEPELEIHGARSATWTMYVQGSQREADESVRWAERSIDFLLFCLPPMAKGRQVIRRIQSRRWAWQAFLSTRADLRSFVEHNASLDILDSPDWIHWGDRGLSCAVTVAMTPTKRREKIVAQIWASYFRGASPAFLDGIVHVATIYLGGTAAMGGKDSGSGIWWCRQMQTQARQATDFSLLELPNLKRDQIHRDTRLKAWSFMTWSMARLPRRWPEFIRKVPSGIFVKPDEFPALVKAFFRKPLAELEDEWRAWAAGRSVTAQATMRGRSVREVPSSSK